MKATAAIFLFVVPLGIVITAAVSKNLLIEKQLRPRPCGELVMEALAKANQEKKRLFVKIGNSSCQSCMAFEGLLTSNDIGPILAKYFDLLIVHYNEADDKKYLENPGVLEWMKQVGLRPNVLVYAVLDQNGNVVTSSQQPSRVRHFGPIFGAPFTYWQIGAFLSLLVEGNPKVTADDLRRIRSILEKEIRTAPLSKE